MCAGNLINHTLGMFTRKYTAGAKRVLIRRSQRHFSYEKQKNKTSCELSEGEGCELTLVSPSAASGSVIQDPYLDPDVFMVIASLIPVSFPQADNSKTQ